LSSSSSTGGSSSSSSSSDDTASVDVRLRGGAPFVLFRKVEDDDVTDEVLFFPALVFLVFFLEDPAAPKLSPTSQ